MSRPYLNFAAPSFMGEPQRKPCYNGPVWVRQISLLAFSSVLMVSLFITLPKLPVLCSMEMT